MGSSCSLKTKCFYWKHCLNTRCLINGRSPRAEEHKVVYLTSDLLNDYTESPQLPLSEEYWVDSQIIKLKHKIRTEQIHHNG